MNSSSIEHFLQQVTVNKGSWLLSNFLLLHLAVRNTSDVRFRCTISAWLCVENYSSCKTWTAEFKQCCSNYCRVVHSISESRPWTSNVPTDSEAFTKNLRNEKKVMHVKNFVFSTPTLCKQPFKAMQPSSPARERTLLAHQIYVPSEKAPTRGIVECSAWRCPSNLCPIRESS